MAFKLSPLASLAIAGVVALASPWAQAQSSGWPAKPVTIVVPFPAGGSADILCRLVAEKFSATWGQTVIIDNVGGAGGKGGAAGTGSNVTTGGAGGNGGDAGPGGAAGRFWRHGRSWRAVAANLGFLLLRAPRRAVGSQQCPGRSRRGLRHAGGDGRVGDQRHTGQPLHGDAALTAGALAGFAEDTAQAAAGQLDQGNGEVIDIAKMIASAKLGLAGKRLGISPAKS